MMSIRKEHIRNADFIVVGAGFTGSVVAREIAEKLHKRVHIIEKRTHIAGNMYDARDKAGIMVQHYGIHVFHTDEKAVADYLERFTQWRPYKVFCLGQIEEHLVPVPFNDKSIDIFYDQQQAQALKIALKTTFPGRESVPIIELLECKNPMIREYAEYLYEHDFRPYTAKQWGIHPEELDPVVISRVPIRLSDNCDYFTAKYQYMPGEGFTEMFRKIITHDLITYELSCDFLELISFENNQITIHIDGEMFVKPILFTGPLDELFGYQYGKLPYRSLRFEYETYQMEYFQPAPFVAYPEHVPYTRIIEFKHFTGENPKEQTTIMKEHPLAYNKEADGSNDPYYPILNDTNRRQHMQYQALAEKCKNLMTGGRLADYKYYYMYEAIMRAWELFENIKGGHFQ